MAERSHFLPPVLEQGRSFDYCERVERGWRHGRGGACIDRPTPPVDSTGASQSLCRVFIAKDDESDVGITRHGGHSGDRTEVFKSLLHCRRIGE